jgi:hypothetical protein
LFGSNHEKFFQAAASTKFVHSRKIGRHERVRARAITLGYGNLRRAVR